MWPYTRHLQESHTVHTRMRNHAQCSVVCLFFLAKRFVFQLHVQDRVARIACYGTSIFAVGFVHNSMTVAVFQSSCVSKC